MSDPTYDPSSTRECRACGHAEEHEFSTRSDRCIQCPCTESDRLIADLRWELKQSEKVIACHKAFHDLAVIEKAQARTALRYADAQIALLRDEIERLR